MGSLYERMYSMFWIVVDDPYLRHIGRLRELTNKPIDNIVLYLAWSVMNMTVYPSFESVSKALGDALLAIELDPRDLEWLISDLANEALSVINSH